MCGIPCDPDKLAPPDAVTGRKLTFDQAFAHIGGLENFITDAGRDMIRANARQYLWKYPDKLTFCTACGRAIEGMVFRHGATVSCPCCGAECQFRHEARGHQRVYDQFILYEWRKSVLDPQTVVLTATHVWRDSTRAPQPHLMPLHIDPRALYVFRPGRAATVYKAAAYDRDRWDAVGSLHPEHTKLGHNTEIVVSHRQFMDALEGTRIGATFEALRDESGRWDSLELAAVANCARRPWLEYLYKSGQRLLAAQLLRLDHVPKEIVPNQRASSPRQLLGLTEAQWFEARRDGIQLEAKDLYRLRKLERLNIGPVKLADARRPMNRDERIDLLLPTAADDYHSPSIGDLVSVLPVKLKRKIIRHILRSPDPARDWLDYYRQLAKLGEIPAEFEEDRWHTRRPLYFTEANTALLLPRDMPAMHQRMTERENALKAEEQAARHAKDTARVQARLAELNDAYGFEAEGLILRPYESAREIITEGQRLHICIGGYVTSYADGKTVICCLRRADAPDTPWRAVEISPATGKVVQDRGAYNDQKAEFQPTPEEKKQIRRFWDAWNARNTDKRRRKAS